MHYLIVIVDYKVESISVFLYKALNKHRKPSAVAHYIRKDFDRKFGGDWNCIVIDRSVWKFHFSYFLAKFQALKKSGMLLWIFYKPLKRSIHRFDYRTGKNRNFSKIITYQDHTLCKAYWKTKHKFPFSFESNKTTFSTSHAQNRQAHVLEQF